MNSNPPIVCKPTPWFLLRAGIMVLMFGVFAALFFRDGAVGYRKKNEAYYLHRTFLQAQEAMERMIRDDEGATAEAWRLHAQAQVVDFPPDRDLLPKGIHLPQSWPTQLGDYERMKSLQIALLWREYARERGFDQTPVEEPYDLRKIHEQWVVGSLCLAIAALAGILLLQTWRRKIVADHEALTTPKGLRVPYRDLKTLDLRKWQSKGLAYLNYEGSAGKGRIRIDGLTYGGFKKEQGEPAEQMMDRIRRHFVGEIIDYAPLNEPSASDTAGSSDPSAQ